LFPAATFHNSANWAGFDCNDSCLPYLDPSDPLFIEIGSQLVQATINALNFTSHYYACDLFNEMTPPIRVMQAWLFLDGFWTTDRVQAFLSKVPLGNLILLDLYSEALPQYSRFNSFYGHPYIWNMLHDFGGNNEMFGTLRNVNTGPTAARNFSATLMIGIGITMEGINQNEVMYEFALEQSWRKQLNDEEIKDWLIEYVRRRYETSDPVPITTIVAWQLLETSVYNNNPHPSRPILVRRPALDMDEKIDFNVTSLLMAWSLMVDASSKLDSDLFRYDLVDLTKEVLRYYFTNVYFKLETAWKNSDLYEFGNQAAVMVDILNDTEILLASDRRFLLGNWIADAITFARNEEELQFYKFNAKLQVSIWGAKYTLGLYDYASKFWSGMMRDYYAPRWHVFLDTLARCLFEDQPLNVTYLNERIFLEAEFAFFTWQADYPTDTKGMQSTIQNVQCDSITIVQSLFKKYRQALSQLRFPDVSYSRDDQTYPHTYLN
ncbi:unnamed protein product, partial [Didymodactylos carnosus]